MIGTGTIIGLLENGPENYLLTDEGDISNYLGVNIKKKLDRTFKLCFILCRASHVLSYDVQTHKITVKKQMYNYCF